MPISYNKNIPVVFLVQEGDELPREATAEDFLKAGYVPADGRGHVGQPAYEETKAEDWSGAESRKECSEECEGCCEGCCGDCDPVGADGLRIDLTTLPPVILDPFKFVRETAGIFAEGYDPKFLKDFNLEDVKDESMLYDPLTFTYKKKDESVAAEPKLPSFDEFAGDLFKGAFSVFNGVKSGLADLLEPIDYSETSKPAAETKTAPEPAEEKPEFSEFEQTVIDKFEEMGLGADAKSAMRKSKEFADFLSSKKPTPEQAKAFAEMLKNGKPPFFG
jgi:hypothetical protein